MKKLIVALLLAVAPVLSQASLQRGARTFVNYCLSCHSAKYQRFNRLAKDLGLTKQEVKENLMFVTDKIGDTMQVAMPSEEAAKWFGKAPPDLSVIARARGADWIYTYLQSFYQDDSRPWGVNNEVFKDVGMPNVLWELQGAQKPVYKTEKDMAGNDTQVFDHFEQVSPGSQSPEEFEETVRDLTNFLVYVGEPIQLKRHQMGKWVLLFIAVFFVLAYLLKKEYWKDVH